VTLDFIRRLVVDEETALEPCCFNKSDVFETFRIRVDPKRRFVVVVMLVALAAAELERPVPVEWIFRRGFTITGLFGFPF